MASSQVAPPSSRIAWTLARVCRVCSRRVGPAGVGALPSSAGRKPTWPATWRMLPFLTPWENFAGGVVWVLGVSAVFSVIRGPCLGCSRALGVHGVWVITGSGLSRGLWVVHGLWGVHGRPARVLPADRVRRAAH